MSSADKTRQQLVDSMRKTKVTAASKKTAAKKTPVPATRAATTKAAAPTTTGKRSAKVEAGSRPETPDPYRVGRRVWPD